MEEILYTFYNKKERKIKGFLFLFFVLILNFINGQTFSDSVPGSKVWTVPDGVTSITVELWGAGGGGQRANGNPSAGGGGSGGGYVKATYPVVAGETYAYFIGAGGTGDSGGNGQETFFFDATTIRAVGGNGAGVPVSVNNTWGQGAVAPVTGNVVGGVAVQINSVYGGKGGDAGDNYSGGGGSSAGNGNNNGNNALGSIAGNAPINGYAGGSGLTNGRNPGNSGGFGAGGSGGRTGSRDADQLGGAGGNGLIIITYTAVCSGTPSGGIANLSAISGAPNSTFTASVTGGSSTPGIAYQWQSATSSSGPWVNISGATGSGAITITAIPTEGITYYRRAVTCTNSGIVSYSSVVSYTTTALSYCAPNFINTDKSKLYISSFQFIGVLNNPPANISTYSTGYQNFTSFTPIAEQPQGTAINMVAYNSTTSGSFGTWKAWVDWNRDGDFLDAGEEVYNMISFTTSSVTFGFVIPVGQAIGNYRLRIGTFSTNGTVFGPCAVNSGFGEMEDYLFKVVADCSAKVLSVNNVNPYDGERCGAGTVRISATGNASAVNYKWYDSEYGGNYLGEGSSFITPSIATTTRYYVTAVSSGGCETAYRYPVDARIDPNPTVKFSASDPAICGEDKPSLLVTAAGDKYQDEFFEGFSAGLGVFSNDDTESVFKSAISSWLNKPTPYIPSLAEGYEGLSPAMSSGYFGGNYAMINSDIDRTTAIKYHLVSNNRNVNGYLNLQLDFDLYHFSIAYNNTEGYIEVSYTLDGSVANPIWVPLVLPGLTTPTTGSLTRYWQNIGTPLKWQHFSITIPGSDFTTSNFKLRFTHFAQGQVTTGPHQQKFYEAITAVDNIRLSGFKNITTPFNWNSPTVDLYQADCATPIGSSLASTVCVKPTATQLEDINWNLNASATFSNGCPAIGSFTVENDTKTWLQPGVTDWNLGAQWKPASVPAINKCVIVRTPVEMPSNTTGTHGFARSVIVKSGGKLNILPKSSLTIQNYIKNEALASDVIMDSDANLVQVNNSAVNIGNMIVKRTANLKKNDYNYWGSPVGEQNVRAFSPETLESKFYTYNGSNDYFDGLFIRNQYPDKSYSLTLPVDKTTYNFIRGKGYAIRASNNLTSTSTDITHQFVGVPYNGVLDVPIVKYTTGGGYNLISNPFPSNIDYYALYNYTYNGGADKNSDLIYETAYFWTNTNYNPMMQGSNYPSNLPSGKQIINNYAVLNGTGGIGAPYGFSGTGTNDVVGSVNNCPLCKVPTKVIKVGQGFIVKAKKTGTFNLRFENGANIRTNSASSIFFNRMANATTETPVNRFWISLKTPLDFVTPLLVGYVEGASNLYEEDFDAELLVLGGDSFYTLLEDKKLGIQGREFPFNADDMVGLGASFGLRGTYEIGLDNKEGIFANGQSIYLKDNLTGIVTNLSQDKYRFFAEVCEENNRFQISYANATLGTSDSQAKKELNVYKENHYAVITSGEDIQFVKMYDTTGKLVFNKKLNTKEYKIDMSAYQTGVYIINIRTTKNFFSKKIIK